MAPESFYVKSSEFGRLTIQTTLIAHFPHVTTLKTDTIVFNTKIGEVAQMVCVNYSFL